MRQLCHICILVVVLQSRSHGQLPFDKQYSVGYDNSLSCHIRSLSDSTYLFINYIVDSASGRQDVGLARLDKSGNLVQNKVYSFQISYMTHMGAQNQFIKGTPSTYFLAGTMVKDGKWVTVMLKINRITLDTVFSRTFKFYPYIYDFALSNFIKVHDNKYILWGTKNNTSSFWPFALVLDSNLTVQATQQLPGNYFHAKCAVWNPVTKTILLAGRLPFHQPFDNIALQEVDTLGVVTHSCISSTSYSLSAANVYFSPIDTSYVLPGVQLTYNVGGQLKFKMNLMKYGSDLKLRWRKSYGNDLGGKDLGGAAVLADGSIVASGTTDHLNNGNFAGVLLKVNSKGVVHWLRLLDHHAGTQGSTEYLRNVAPTYDNGLVAVGESSTNWIRKAWAVKTNSAGCVIPACQNYTVTVDSMLLDPPPPVTITAISDRNSGSSGFSVFPNPTATEFTFKRYGTSDENIIIQITDVTGRLFYRVILYTASEVLLGHELKSGVYILSALNQKGTVIYRQKILKE